MTLSWNRTTAFFTGFVLALLIVLGFWCWRENKPSKPLPDAAQGIATHDVKTEAPIKAYDKKELYERAVIPHSALRNPHSEVTAAATIKDDSGTRHVAAELDTKTGVTQLVEKRPFMEWMDRWEAGAGYGLYEGDTAKGAQLRWTFGRAWILYGSAQVEVFDIDRIEDPHPWNAMVWVTGRF